MPNIYDRRFFAKIIHGFMLLTIFTKIFIIDLWHASKYAPRTANVTDKLNPFPPSVVFWKQSSDLNFYEMKQ